MDISTLKYGVFAEKLLRECDSYTLPIPIIKIANHLGFDVYERKMDPEDLGEIILGGKASNHIAKIFINNTLNVIGRKLVIANELAHFLLQDNRNTYYHRNRCLINDLETNVSKLATEILAPRELVIDVVEMYRKKYWPVLMSHNLAIFLEHDLQVSITMARKLVQKYYLRNSYEI